MSTFADFQAVAARCDGYQIDHMAHYRIEDADTLDISLTAGPHHPDITLSFRSIYYAEIGHTPGPSTEPLDDVSATPLPPNNEPWPEGLHYDYVRSDQLPPLIWFHAAGPVQLNILAAQATATTAKPR